jgi:hypothetical protein
MLTFIRSTLGGFQQLTTSSLGSFFTCNCNTFCAISVTNFAAAPGLQLDFSWFLLFLPVHSDQQHEASKADSSGDHRLPSSRSFAHVAEWSLGCFYPSHLLCSFPEYSGIRTFNHCMVDCFISITVVQAEVFFGYMAFLENWFGRQKIMNSSPQKNSYFWLYFHFP